VSGARSERSEPRIPCVGAVVRDGLGRLLLVRRANEPGRGLWSIPGGRVEAGETDEQAVAREVMEETGIAVTVGRFVGAVARQAPAGGTYDIRDYLADPLQNPEHPAAGDDAAGPRPRAGDDATDARWVAVAELVDLPLVPGLVEALTDWSVLSDPGRTVEP
jgi:8-oxo-dGTP diphosphatase